MHCWGIRPKENLFDGVCDRILLVSKRCCTLMVTVLYSGPLLLNNLSLGLRIQGIS